MSAEVPIHVVKIGGSLLELPGLGERLCAWFDNQRQQNPAVHFVVIMGGGTMVDALREIDDRHDLGDQAAHWLAIDLMAINTRVIHKLWPAATLVDEWDKLADRLKQPGWTLFTATQFLRQVEAGKPGRRLPASWSVTSDSIAGRLAVVLGSERLVLLKWCVSPNAEDRSGESFEHINPYVDKFFETLWPELPPTELMSFSAVSVLPDTQSTASVRPCQPSLGSGPG